MSQVLTESLLIALLGGALGVGVAYYGANALVSTLSVGSTALPLDVRPDPERVCPRDGCLGPSLGALLVTQNGTCAAVAVVGNPGRGEHALIRWSGRLTVRDRVIPYRDPPESHVTLQEATPCEGMGAELAEEAVSDRVRRHAHADGLARTLPGAGIGLGALTTHWQAAEVADAAVALDALEALQVHADFTAQVAFDYVLELIARAEMKGLADSARQRGLGFGRDFAPKRAFHISGHRIEVEGQQFRQCECIV